MSRVTCDRLSRTETLPIKSQKQNWTKPDTGIRHHTMQTCPFNEFLNVQTWTLSSNRKATLTKLWTETFLFFICVVSVTRAISFYSLSCENKQATRFLIKLCQVVFKFSISERKKKVYDWVGEWYIDRPDCLERNCIKITCNLNV